MSTDIKELIIKLSECEERNLELISSANIERKKTQKFIQVLIKRHEDDRRDISRELHDEVSQLLTGVNFQLSVLKKEASNSDDKIQTKIIDTQDLISTSVETIHRFARGLRPVILDDLGLAPALKTAIKDFTRMTNIPVTFSSSNGLTNLSCMNKTVLFRVAQESLTNIIKHAKATKVTISLEKIGTKVHLSIHDNGKSFKIKTRYYRKKHFGIGIQGMEERVKMIQGKFKITSEPKRGTKIHAIVPFVSDKQE